MRIKEISKYSLLELYQLRKCIDDDILEYKTYEDKDYASERIIPRQRLDAQIRNRICEIIEEE
jgi:hypothetical protein